MFVACQSIWSGFSTISRSRINLILRFCACQAEGNDRLDTMSRILRYALVKGYKGILGFSVQTTNNIPHAGIQQLA